MIFTDGNCTYCQVCATGMRLVMVCLNGSETEQEHRPSILDQKLITQLVSAQKVVMLRRQCKIDKLLVKYSC